MSREQLRTLLPFLLFFVALALFISHRLGWLAPVEGFLLRATAPLQAGVTSATVWIEDLAQSARDLEDLRSRNEQLEADNARLLLEILRLREVQHDAAVCSDLLGFRQLQPGLDVQGSRVVGRVVGQDPSNLQRFITIDVGRDQGIERNMPVLTDRGLVGRIADAGATWSRVLLIIDASSSVNALTQSTRATGLVQGQPDGSLLMRDIPQADTVSVGDIVLTSGLGGNFPAGQPIGQVVAVDRKDSDLYQVATVEPTVEFERLEQVIVVTGWKPAEGASGSQTKP
jgi:rod shape-determining protein MreC